MQMFRKESVEEERMGVGRITYPPPVVFPSAPTTLSNSITYVRFIIADISLSNLDM